MLSMIERVRQLEFLWILGAKYPRVHSRQVCELKELEHTSYPMHQFRASCETSNILISFLSF
uniref:Uncharacterized protein n=1 Tax=Physcomitrium patens TaxID=3218 RepID=A0A2K1KJE5_PHYPA|nr:hypothetical protein PHYPA_007574 [Physcomitrium patens]